MAKPQSNADKHSNTAASKWGKKVIEYGFCIVPSLLLQAQSRLGLNQPS